MTKKLRLFLPLLAVVLSVVSCNLPREARGDTPFPAGTPTVDIVGTLTALPNQAAIQPSNTAAPTLTTAPTSTTAPTWTTAPVQQAQPTSTNVPVVQITPVYVPPTAQSNPGNPPPPPPQGVRLSFPLNATNVTVGGTLGAGQMRNYVIRAMAGQFMMVGVSSQDRRAILSVYIPSTGQVFLSKTAGQSDWQGRLPLTTDYIVRVTDTGYSSSYTLQVTIPEVIQFAPGAISATRSYPITARDTHTFSLRAMAGQTMTVTLTSPDGDVLLGVYKYQNGEPLKRYEIGDPSFSGILPETTDYLITAVSDRDSSANFTMKVVIE